MLLLLSGFVAGSAVLAGSAAKLIAAYLSCAITVIAYTHYILQMFPSEGQAPKKPEPLTWLLFGFLTGTGAVVQVMQSAGAGSWCLLLTSAACFVISITSYLRWRSEWRFDRFHRLIAVASVGLFAFGAMTSHDPRLATLSAVLATAADLVSYAPTFRKARLRPHDDSVGNFALNSLKTLPALYALPAFTLATAVYLCMLAIVNSVFALYLYVRQQQPISRAQRAP